MRRVATALLVGGLAGLFAAATTVLACEISHDLRYGSRIEVDVGDTVEILWTTAATAGPGAALMDVVLAALLRRGAGPAWPRGAVLLIGSCAGALLSLPVLILALWLGGRGEEIAWLFHLVRGSSRINLGAAMAGGSVHGLVTAWLLSRPPGSPATAPLEGRSRP